jgi:uncharacterized protein
MFPFVIFFFRFPLSRGITGMMLRFVPGSKAPSGNPKHIQAGSEMQFGYRNPKQLVRGGRPVLNQNSGFPYISLQTLECAGTPNDMSSPTFKGTTTLITGATSGIGRATALRIAAAGGDLVIAARDDARLREFASELESAHGCAVRILRLDVSDAGETVRILGAFAGEHRIDHAVINAGIGQYGPFSQTNWDDVASVLRTNLEGALATARAVLPSMISRGAGSVVFVSSVLGKRAIPWNAAYCASKQALHGFADALRLEVRRHGVHVGVVAPARTDTDFFRRMISTVPRAKERRVPTSSPDQVAQAILRNILGRRRETVVSIGGKAYSFFGYHFPRLTDIAFSRAVPSPE